MSEPDEVDPAAIRRARRAVAKATHPDRGGDPETHRRAMEAIESIGPDTSLLGSARRRLRDLRRLPTEVKEAFQEGRETDEPL